MYLIVDLESLEFCVYMKSRLMHNTDFDLVRAHACATRTVETLHRCKMSVINRGYGTAAQFVSSFRSAWHAAHELCVNWFQQELGRSHQFAAGIGNFGFAV